MMDRQRLALLLTAAAVLMIPPTAIAGEASGPGPGGDAGDALRHLENNPGLAERAEEMEQTAATIERPLATVDEVARDVLELRAMLEEKCVGDVCAWDVIVEIVRTKTSLVVDLDLAFDVLEQVQRLTERVLDRLRAIEAAGTEVYEETQIFLDNPGEENLERLQATYADARPVYEDLASDLLQLGDLTQEAATRTGNLEEALRAAPDADIPGVGALTGFFHAQADVVAGTSAALDTTSETFNSEGEQMQQAERIREDVLEPLGSREVRG